jgi:hypothetical protein
MPRLQKQAGRTGGPQVTAKLGTTTCTWGTHTHSSGPQTQLAFAGWSENKSPEMSTEPAKTVLIMAGATTFSEWFAQSLP